MNMKKVSIIIPNYNGQQYLEDCLLSLKGASYDNHEVILVDNGSKDNSVEVAQKLSQGIIVIKNKDNLGFAAAVNQGIKKALSDGAKYILLLNNDTVVTPDFLLKMKQTAETDEKIGVVGCKINYFTDKEKVWFAGGRYIKWRASGQHIAWQKNDDAKLYGVVDCDFVTGCSMLIKKEVFGKIGYFFEPFFLGVEDLDFCLRATDAGWKIKVDLDALIYHKVSLSRDGEFSFSNGYYGTRNRLHWAFRMRKNFFGGFVLLFIILPIRVIQWSLQSRFKMVKGIMIGVKDFILGRVGQKHSQK
jgi:GT2 family glycosyltransferase